MARCSGYKYVAIVLLLGLVGCTTTDLFQLESRSTPIGPNAGTSDRFVLGSLQDVFSSTTQVLDKMCSYSHVTREGAATRFECHANTGAQFSLMLTDWDMKTGKHTRIHVVMEDSQGPQNGPCDLTIMQILDCIEAQCTSDLQASRSRTKSPPMVPPNTSMQAQWLDHIKKLGGSVTRDYPVPNGAITGIDLHQTLVTDADLEQLKDCPNLRTLNLYDTRITDAGLKNVSGLTSLQMLYLNKTQITDSGLQHLQGLIHLNELGLCHTRVTDEGLFYLKGLPNLCTLALSGDQITDQGLLQLRRLHDLKKLSLNDTSVTTAGVQELKKSLPKMMIIQ